MSDFTQEEYDSINPREYEAFEMDWEEIPEFKEVLEKFKGGRLPVKISTDTPEEERRKSDRLKKYWILTHDIKRKNQSSTVE